jgi:uncharacterized sodium:solute symporter family permease YidK
LTSIDLIICCVAVLLFPFHLCFKIDSIPEFWESLYNRAAQVFFSGLMLVICIMILALMTASIYAWWW